MYDEARGTAGRMATGRDRDVDPAVVRRGEIEAPQRRQVTECDGVADAGQSGPFQHRPLIEIPGAAVRARERRREMAACDLVVQLVTGHRHEQLTERRRAPVSGEDGVDGCAHGVSIGESTRRPGAQRPRCGQGSGCPPPEPSCQQPPAPPTDHGVSGTGTIAAAVAARLARSTVRPSSTGASSPRTPPRTKTPRGPSAPASTAPSA